MFMILLLFLYHTSALAKVSVRQHRQEDPEKYGVPDLRTTVRPVPEASGTWVARPTQAAIPTWIVVADEESDEESDEEAEEPQRMVFLVQQQPPLPPSYSIPQPLPPVSFYTPTVQYVPLFPHCCQSGPLPLLPYYL